MNLCKNKFMRRPIIILVLGLTCLCAASPAVSRTFTGGNGITVTAPDGWTAEHYDQPDGQITLISPDKACLVSVQFIPDMGLESKEFSEFFSQGVNGSMPEKISGQDMYSFEAVIGGMPLLAFTHAGEAGVFLFMVIGKTDDYASELRAIRASLHSNDSTVQKVLDVLK